MVKLNFDADIQDKVTVDLDPAGPVFQALPMTVQLSKLEPYIKAQRARDAQRLSRWTSSEQAIAA